MSIAGLIPFAIYLKKMCEMGAFEAWRNEEPYKSSEANHVGKDRELVLPLGTKHWDTKSFNPDRFWSQATVFIYVGYFVSAICLFTVAVPKLGGIKEFWGTDQVLRQYDTFHPCILLDYL